MDGNILSADQVIAELVGMGFEFSDVVEAVKVMGPSVNDAVDFIVNGSGRNSQSASCSAKSATIIPKTQGKRALLTSRSSGRMRQPSITEHLKSAGTSRRSRASVKSDALVSGSAVISKFTEKPNEAFSPVDLNLENTSTMSPLHSYCNKENNGTEWEQNAYQLLHKHFGYSSLKSFQKEALAAWSANQDCLVLAATGSGKSLCFQIPALLTGKVVVVISPLISLMHDQCLKLAKHGVSACFLGSGQTDSSVEQKAMRGMYGIVYVCPETILRLIKPLQSLAENRGIALFAIDEVHCVSKWGHDFRPDYRRLSVLRESFRSDKLKSLQYDIPLMALTATATVCVREDILKSLCMSKETKIVLTSFFRPNLQFSVKHSRTSFSSYEEDFHELIDSYVRKNKSGGKKPNMISQHIKNAPDKSIGTSYVSISEADKESWSDVDNSEDGSSSEFDDEMSSPKENGRITSNGKKLSVEFLEDDCDLYPDVDDLDVSCGEFYGQSPDKESDGSGPGEKYDQPNNPEESLKLLEGPLEHGSTIIYVPTRKGTVSIAKFLCRHGVKAAAYNAKLPKSHLRQVHKDFHENALEVVVATIAFGMGIDKSNVRRIIHYGWPQSLEAYYQEAGRAGRDGKLAHCVLYANLSRTPTLLPSQRSKEQTKQAYKMLSDCFRYGMSTSSCRAKTLVEYFGEQFSQEKCFLCDVCVNGPPEIQNLRAEADIFMQIIAAYYVHNQYERQNSFSDGNNDYLAHDGIRQPRFMERPNINMVVREIREQFPKYATSDLLWWRGLVRILENEGFVREEDDKNHVQIKFPVPTDLGIKFLQCQTEQSFYAYPEADMVLSTSNCKSFSTFSEWGRGWADPEIRRQRLGNKRSRRKSRKRKASKHHPDLRTVRGRLASKLKKQKQ